MTADHEPTAVQESALAAAGLIPLATARSRRAADAAPHRRIPGLYADPASWAVLQALDGLWSGGPDGWAAAGTTAMVLVSSHGTVETMAEIARVVPGGRLSPLRFAGAGPGGPVSVACQVHGLRGPTLVLTSEPEVGCPAALSMARHWLRTGAASEVVLAVHDHDPLHGHAVHCVVVTAAPEPQPSGGPG